MSTTPYIISGVQPSLCNKCKGQIIWQTSYRNGKRYPTDVKKVGADVQTARNWFHQCPPQVQQQANMFAVKMNVRAIHELFDKAQVHLKYPKIRLQTSSGQPVALYRAGPRSKYRGQLMVTNGESYGNSTFFGRIDSEGIFHEEITSTDEINQLLQLLAVNPAETASQYGRLTGNCCFCNLPLKDERSTSVGYGPVCADHFGLPWG